MIRNDSRVGEEGGQEEDRERNDRQKEILKVDKGRGQDNRKEKQKRQDVPTMRTQQTQSISP